MQSPPRSDVFGLLPRFTKIGDGTFPLAAEKIQLIDRKLWKPVSLNRHVTTVFDQLDGMCAANAAVQTKQVEESFRGRDPVVYSPENLYTQIARWGEGASLDSVLNALKQTGVCTREQIPPEDWRQRDWRDDWSDDAEPNRILESLDCPGFDWVASALQQGRPCCVGVTWPRGGGHAVCVTELVIDGRLVSIRGPNSWGGNWGEMPGYTTAEVDWLEGHAYSRPILTGGWYTLTERQCDDFRLYGAWTLGASASGRTR